MRRAAHVVNGFHGNFSMRGLVEITVTGYYSKSPMEPSHRLILSPLYDTDSRRLRDVALNAGWKVTRLDAPERPEWLESKGEKYALHGGLEFVGLLRRDLGLGILEPADNLLTRVPGDFLLRRIEYVSAEQAASLTRPAFIKPPALKTFKARVYDSGAAFVAEAKVPPHEMVLISDPVDWEVEYRFFVLEGEAIARSGYLRHGKPIQKERPGESAQAGELVRGLVKQCGAMLPPAMVVDVGYVSDQGWAVIEFNAATSSGLYNCDATQVLRTIERACVPLQGASKNDARSFRREGAALLI